MSIVVHCENSSTARFETGLSNGLTQSKGFGSPFADSIKINGGRGIDSTSATSDVEHFIEDKKITPEQLLFDRLVDLKVKTSSLAMHLETAWRTGLFNELDKLLNVDDWDLSDTMPTVESFVTFLRTTIFLGKIRRPGLGATVDGNILAGWITGRDRLTIEYRPNDELRWVTTVDGSAHSGACVASDLKDNLASFKPERWFTSANNVRS
jgi:hypothetical protein